MKRTMRALTTFWRQLGATRWRWVIMAGFAIPILAAALWMLVTVGYGVSLGIRARGVPDRGQIEHFREQGVWVVPVLVLALTGGGASFVARRVGGPIMVQGALIGTASASVGMVLWSHFHDGPIVWAWVAAILTVGAGWLGGLEAQSTVEGREALYQASRAISAAQSPQAVVEAIGAHQADPRVGRVALWQVTARGNGGAPPEIGLLAAWAPPGSPPWPGELRMRLDRSSQLARLRPEVPTVLAPEALPGEERATWERLGIRSAVVVPLIGRDGGWLGLITMAYPSARGLGGGAAGGYLAIGAQAALALENLQLVEQGRQIGALAERQRLAREIHDSVKQQVFATGMQIGAALALIERDPGAAKARLAEADALVRQAQDELAAVIHELRPATLDGRGLAVTLREYAARWSRQSDIAAEVRVAEGCAIPLEAEQALFRVAQEALANVARHSGSATATVELACEDGAVTLRVTDDGRGFAAGELDGRGYGLASMGERVAGIGGKVTVESAPGEGTRVTCVCPLGERHAGG